MKQYMQTHIYITLTLLVLACSVALGAFVSNYNQRKIESILRTELHEQGKRLMTIAEITDRNGADEAIAEIITDCERRDEYESLLVKLGSLTKKDLILLQGLFEKCGNFDAEKKALMVAKFEREFEGYNNLLILLRTLTEKDITSYQEDVWKDIVSHEKLRGDLLRDLTTIQKEIISELISGSVVHSARVTALVEEAQNIGQLLIVYDRRIDEGRESIIK